MKPHGFSPLRTEKSAIPGYLVSCRAHPPRSCAPLYHGASDRDCAERESAVAKPRRSGGMAGIEPIHAICLTMLISSLSYACCFPTLSPFMAHLDGLPSSDASGALGVSIAVFSLSKHFLGHIWSQFFCNRWLLDLFCRQIQV